MNGDAQKPRPQGHASPFPPGERASVPTRTARRAVAVLVRQAGLIAVCALVGTAASALLWLGEPRIYTSTAKVRVRTGPSERPIVAARGETPPADPRDREIETEVALMRARANAQAVVAKYAIDDSQLVHGDAVPAADGRSRTVDLFLDGLSVAPLRSGAVASPDVLEVRFDCTDPALAPRALQAVLDNYLRLGAQQSRRAGETTASLIETRLGRARDDLRQSEDRIVALLVPDAGRAAGGGLRQDLGLDAAVVDRAPVVAAAPEHPAPGPRLRLDEARLPDVEAAASPGPQLATPVRENTPLETGFNRLERGRRLAQERDAELQRELDQVDLSLLITPAASARRVVIEAPGHPTLAEGRRGTGVVPPGPIAGLLLGLLLATLREFGGDRLRSPRAAERALGVPVLGAIPTLSPKAMSTYFVPSNRAPAARAAEPA